MYTSNESDTPYNNLNSLFYLQEKPRGVDYAYLLEERNEKDNTFVSESLIRFKLTPYRKFVRDSTP